MNTKLRKAYEQWLTTDDEIMSEDKVMDMHLDHLNETEIDVLGVTYGAGYLLAEIDPIRLREYYLDYLDAFWKEIDAGGATMYAREDDDPEERFLEEMCFECEECWENYLYEDLREHDGRSLCPPCHAWYLMEDEGEGEE